MFCLSFALASHLLKWTSKFFSASLIFDGIKINYFGKDGLVYSLVAKASQMRNDSVFAIIVTALKDLDVVIL